MVRIGGKRHGSDDIVSRPLQQLGEIISSLLLAANIERTTTIIIMLVEYNLTEMFMMCSNIQSRDDDRSGNCFNKRSVCTRF